MNGSMRSQSVVQGLVNNKMAAKPHPLKPSDDFTGNHYL